MRLYRFFSILLTVWLAGCNQAQQNKETDEKAIRNAAQAYQESYNQQDAEKLSELWTSNASFLNPVTGEFAEGRESIKNFFKEKFSQGKKRQLEITINSIEFLNKDEAIENGLIKVTFPYLPTQHAAYQLKYIKEDGKWLISAINEIELQEATSNFKQLKDLAWLVGKWKDSDENIQILFNNQWDKYKNFITQQFKMEIYGQDDIEGKQIIAWDPAKDSIRSWVFDSDGGFGEGTWEKVEKSWYATMRYTLSDGRIASSKNIYTPIDDQSYTFASIEREVDGEILPDMNPVTVEKIE